MSLRVEKLGNYIYFSGDVNQLQPLNTVKIIPIGNRVRFDYLYENISLSAGRKYSFSEIIKDTGFPCISVADMITYLLSVTSQAGGGGGGTITNVTASSPLQSSGGATPNISFISQANGNYSINFASGVPSLSLIGSLGSFKGGWDASGGTTPTGVSIVAGDYYRITVAGTLTGLISGNPSVSIGDIIVSNVSNPIGNSDYFALQSNFSTSEDITVGGVFAPLAGTVLGSDNVKLALEKIQGNIDNIVVPIFLDETSTIADFQTGNTYYYIGETAITYNYDLLPQPPNPAPASGFNFVNLSTFDVTFFAGGGNSVYLLKPTQSLQDIQVTDSGGGTWDVIATQYNDNLYDLQQVTNKGNVTTNPLIVRNNPDTYRTRYSILGQGIQRDDLGFNLNYYDNGITKLATGSKSWILQIPDLTTNANSSTFTVGFRPNVSGTVAYLSDVPTSLPTTSNLQYVTSNGNTTNNDVLFDSGRGIRNISGGTLSIGEDSDIINIGIGANSKVINVGNQSTLLDQINLYGAIFNQTVTNINVSDKLVAYNVGGAASSGFDSGFEIEENGIITGYIKTNLLRSGWLLKAPSTFEVNLDLSLLTVDSNYQLQDGGGVLAFTTDITNIFTHDGALTSNRNLDGANLYGLNFADLTAFNSTVQNVGISRTEFLQQNNAFSLVTTDLVNFDSSTFNQTTTTTTINSKNSITLSVSGSFALQLDNLLNVTLQSLSGSGDRLIQVNSSGLLSASIATSTITSLASNSILRNGNTFGATMVIGTNDNFDLNLETNGTTRVVIGANATTTLINPNVGATLVINNTNTTVAGAARIDLTTNVSSVLNNIAFENNGGSVRLFDVTNNRQLINIANNFVTLGNTSINSQTLDLVSSLFTTRLGNNAGRKFFIFDNLDYRFVVESDNTLTVGATVNYESLVTSNNDIPNKKYIDDKIWSNSNLATMLANTVKVNATASTASPQDLAITTNQVLGRLAGNLQGVNVVDSNITNGTDIANLENPLNWNGNNNYIGATLANSQQGQKYLGDKYLYLMVTTLVPIRMPRYTDTMSVLKDTVTIATNTKTNIGGSYLGVNTIVGGSLIQGTTFTIKVEGLITSNTVNDAVIGIEVGGVTVPVTIPVNNTSDQYFGLEFTLTFNTLGLNGKFRGQGRAYLESGIYPIRMTANSADIDTDLDINLNVSIDFTSGANTATITNYTITRQII